MNRGLIRSIVFVNLQEGIRERVQEHSFIYVHSCWFVGVLIKDFVSFIYLSKLICLAILS
ncbi:hypothetical protein HanRHA438_Chr15g0701081 [Helianthus annuus]|nr:hypothetical protein HanRHA438_Chr15g0701081 [Helianthus annuus]